MTIRQEQLYEMSVCGDCMRSANGYEEDEPIQDYPDIVPWSLVADTVLSAGGSDGELGFSWSPCEACGIALGGDRYKATLVDGSV